MPITFNRRHLLSAAGAAALNVGLAGQATAQGAGPKPADWAKAPAVQFACLSPDGKHLAYIFEENGDKSIISLDVDTKKPSRINIGKATVSRMMWIDDSHVLVVTTISARAMGGAADQGSYLVGNVYNLAKASMITLYHEVPSMIGIVTGNLYAIQKDGKTQITASGLKEDHDDFDYLYGFDLDSGKGTLLDFGPKELEDRVVTAEGTLVGRSAYYYHTRAWILEYYNGGAWKEIYRTTVERDSPSLLGLAADGKSLVVQIPDAGDVGNYYEMAPDGTLSAPLTDDPDLETPYFHARTHRMIGLRRDTDWVQYKFTDPAMAALAAKAQTAMDTYRMRIVSYGDDPSRAIIYSEGEDDAGTYYYIDFNSGLILPIGSEYPDVPTDWIADKAPITYAASDGTQIEAMLTLPPHRDPKGLSLVVIPHAGWQRTSLASDWFVQMFATAGYAVLQPNYRGSDGYGQDFLTAGRGQWGGKMLTDLSDGVKYLVGQGKVDAKRVCIVGENVPGGYLGLAGVALQQGVYNCAVDLAGLSDVSIFMSMMSTGPLTTTDPSYQFWLRRFGDPSIWDNISPVKHASDVNVPVLIVHSLTEPGIPYQQSQKMADALKGAGKDVTFLKTDNTDNWRSVEAWRMTVVNAVLPFVVQHNPA